MQEKQIKAKIERIKGELLKLGEMRPGSLSKQYSACKKPGCACIDPDRPRKHGPYYQLSYSHGGRSTTQFVRPQFVPTVKRQLATYKRYRRLTDEWVGLALELAKLKLEEAKREESD